MLGYGAMTAFEVAIGSAEAGWLDLALTVDGGETKTQASRVLNDPLDELATAARVLLQHGSVDVQVRFWEEPGWESLRFWSDEGDSERVHVGLSTGSQAVVDRTMVGKQIVCAFREYDGRLPLSGKIDGWGVFPNEPLRRAIGVLEPDVPVRPFESPWSVPAHAARFEAELRAEVGEHHLLHGVSLTPCAVNVETDECLFETGSAFRPLAVVCLTWEGRRTRSVRCPATTLYSSWREWAAACMPPRR